MYGDQEQFDLIFAMLYGGVAVVVFLSCIYFIFTRSNIIEPSIKPPSRLRLWAAAFLAAGEGQTVTIKYNGTKKVKRVTAAMAAPRPQAEGHALTASALGEIVGSDGRA